jgi:hypothetical protein
MHLRCQARRKTAGEVLAAQQVLTGPPTRGRRYSQPARWGGGLADFRGATLTVSNTTVDHNLASGGDGLGGGIYEDALSSLTLIGVTVEYNLATGGAAGIGGSDGQGVGGGLDLTPGGVAYADLLTVILRNHASTSDDDVFGTLGSC